MSLQASADPIRQQRGGGRRTWMDVLIRTSVFDLIGPSLEQGFERATHGLPEASRGVVIATARATRLWRGEQIDVAHELGSHFREGLAMGRAEAEMLTRFGDARRTAKLIRKSKRRQRSIAWHAMFWANRGILAAIAVSVIAYAALWARVEWGRPNITRDYLAELASATPATAPEIESYRVLARASAQSYAWCMQKDFYNYPLRDADNSDMDCARAWVADLAEPIRQTRAAAKLPRLANVFAPDVIAERERIFAEIVPNWKNRPTTTEDLMQYDYRCYGDVRSVARLLMQDAICARDDGAASRMLADWQAILDLSRQVRSEGHPFAVSMSAGLMHLVFYDVRYTLAFRPDLLSRDELTQLVHCLAALRAVPTETELSAERAWNKLLRDDFLQRHFTDDGSGDGYMLPSGFAYLDDQAKSAGYAGRFGLSAERLLGRNSAAPGWSWLVDDGSGATVCDVIIKGLGPLDATAIAGRREVSEKWAEVDESLVRSGASPPFSRDTRDYARVVGEIQNPDNLRRLAIVRVMTRDKVRFQFAGWYWRVVQDQDATLAALAIEIYRRDHGALPATLQALVPRYLPAVPVDIYDGGPMAYRVTPSGPLLYSVGPDRIDEDGVPQPIASELDRNARGDEVLFPLEREVSHY